MKKGFDAERYIAAQSAEILKRVRRFGRLYLEVGGKLCSDEHAFRVLPGYRKTSKIEILKGLGDLEIVYCVSAKDLASGREVGLSGLSYEEKVLRDLKDIDGFGFDKVVIIVTRFSEEKEVRDFVLKLKRYKIYFHDEVEGYGKDMALTLKGYERNDYVDVGSDLVVVTGPGSGSGKMGFALSQIYYERRKKIKTGFAKFESFPIWNLPMNHPVNLAYEAATADLGDYNVIDKYHLRRYGKRAVNYNRDVENFEILLKIGRLISGERWFCGYKSPTDMGVNMMRKGIVDDLVCRRAAKLEIERRFRGALKESLERDRIGKIIKKLGRE
ncbi:DUF1846 family protein [Candidatus Pacearchaeota archaeon]|nr:DUF1846 family protein [Candidatus Pacearchaeota archaeon]